MFHLNTLSANLSQTSDLEHITSMLNSDVGRFQFLMKTLAPQLIAHSSYANRQFIRCTTLYHLVYR